MPKNKVHVKNGSTLIVDIGSASVGAAVISKGKLGVPQLNEVTRVPIGLGSPSSREALTTHTEEALKKLLEHYITTPIKKINVVVSAPWHEASIRTITSTSQKPVNISERTAVSAVQKYQNEKPPHEGNVDVEAVAVQMRVNGYSTSLKKMVSGTSISINLYESEMRSNLQKKFTSIIESAFPNSSVHFNTFPLASTVALRTISESTGFIVTDIAGEATEVSIVHEDGLRHIASFPVGYYSVARKIGASQDKIGDAMSRLALLARGELTPEEAANVKKEFSEVFKEWMASFEDVIRAASQNFPIPRTLYLLSDKEPLSWLKLGIEEVNTFSLHVVPAGAPLVQTHVETGDNAHYDVFLSLEALFFHIGKDALVGEDKELGVVYSR